MLKQSNALNDKRDLKNSHKNQDSYIHHSIDFTNDFPRPSAM